MSQEDFAFSNCTFIVPGFLKSIFKDFIYLFLDTLMYNIQRLATSFRGKRQAISVSFSNC